MSGGLSSYDLSIHVEWWINTETLRSTKSYLSREFSIVIVITVHAPPLMSSILSQSSCKYSSTRLDNAAFSSEDISLISLNFTLLTFSQCVKCNTGDNNVLDLCYLNVNIL